VRSLGNAERFVAGAVGEPGSRVFLIEVEGDGPTEWFLVEKQQVAALAERSIRLLRQLGLSVAEPGPALEAPGEPTFRVGEIALGSDGDAVVIVLSPTDEGEPVTFTVSADRLGAMAQRALEVVAAGRPLCRFCGLPIDPDGHPCPASNGDLRGP
jgi:uncharacterized repeat protein (TIGR03847 family)